MLYYTHKGGKPVKRLIAFFLCLALLIPGAIAEPTGGPVTFTSHYERYSITLPEGSAHVPVHDAARLSGTTVASMHFNEVDCFAIGPVNYMNMQTMCTPYGKIFRSDMLDFTDSMLEFFTSTYMSYGYPADMLEIALEPIGEYPFVRIDVQDDPMGITEYYTYGSNGTEYIFSFLGTTTADEHAILSTLQLAEPTEIVADYTEGNLRDKLRKKTPQVRKDPFLEQFARTFESNFGYFTIELPADSLHLKNKDVCRQYGMTEVMLKFDPMDAFCISDNNYINLEVYRNNGFYSPQELRDDPNDVIEVYQQLYAEFDFIDQDSIVVTCETIGAYDMICVSCRQSFENQPESELQEYYVFDEQKNEYNFCFWDMPEAECRAIMKTLTLIPPEKGEASIGGLAGKALKRTDDAETRSDNYAPPERNSGKTTAFVNEKHAYSITLPGNMYQLPSSTVDSIFEQVHEFHIAEGKSTETWDTAEARGLELSMYANLTSTRFLTVYVYQVPHFTREELLNHSESVIEFIRKDAEDNLLDPDDFHIGFETIGTQTYVALEGAMESIPFTSLMTIGENGRLYDLTFEGFSPEEVRAIMETFVITASEASESSQPEADESRTFVNEKLRYSITLPASADQLPDPLAFLLFNNAYDQARSMGMDTGIWDTAEARRLELSMYADMWNTSDKEGFDLLNFLSGKALTIYVWQLPDSTREEFLNQEDGPLEIARKNAEGQLLDPDHCSIGYETIGGNPFTVIEGRILFIDYIEFSTVGENGLQYTLSFEGYSPEEARAILETFTILP